jgi:hypothetical protein
MKYWERFTNFKQRGEWVELQFMAQAAQHHFAVSKPWGDTRAYDVGIEHGENFLRVQVKSTTSRSGAGYRCQFMPNHQNKHDYSLNQIDLFAAYVIPEDACLVSDPGSAATGPTKTHHGHAMPGRHAREESQLHLRRLSGSMENAHQEQE